jgi:hypothetical protein
MAPEIIEGVLYTCAVDWWAFGVLMYEMLFGRSPFKGADMKKTFENICRAHVDFPHHPHHEESVSPKCKDLIKHLLHHNFKKRLGVLGGASEIKDHPFFVDVKFQLLPHQTPPIIPHVSSAIDSHYFHDFAKDPWSSDAEDQCRSLDPDTLPDDLIWKRFSNIDRGDLDPDDLCGSSLTPRRVLIDTPPLQSSLTPTSSGGTSSSPSATSSTRAPINKAKTPKTSSPTKSPTITTSPTTKSPAKSPPESPRQAPHHEHGMLHHLFKLQGH